MKLRDVGRVDDSVKPEAGPPWCAPSRVGDVEHHQYAMTASGLSLSAEPSAQYPVRQLSQNLA
jgi:hypothetical protein